MNESKLSEMTYEEFWEHIKGIIEEDFDERNPNNLTELKDELLGYTIETVQDERENEYYFITCRITNNNVPEDTIMLSWVGYYDSWNGTEWQEQPCQVIEKSEMRLVTWYEETGWE